MNYQQLVQPNLNATGQPGLCLAYVEDVFKTPHTYYNATEGWEKAQFKHTDQPPPSISVPIWFSWQVDGHVAVWANGTIYSTTAQGVRTFVSIPALMAYIGGGITYLGWSEDLENVRIVKGVTMEPWNSGDTYNLLWQTINKQTADEAKAAGYFGDESGRDPKIAMYDIINSEQYAQMKQAAWAPSNFVPYNGTQLYQKS